MVLKIILENDFEASSSSIRNVLDLWKWHFLDFFQIFEQQSCESKPKHQKLIKSKFRNRNLLRKWFWSFDELKNKYCGRLKIVLFIFWTFLSNEVETTFWERETMCSNVIKSKLGHRKLAGKGFWSFLELKNGYCGGFEINTFYFFTNFWLAKLKPFSRKVRQSVQNYLNQKEVL